MLTVLHLITGLEAGGAERMLVQLATGSDRRRFRSIIVSMVDAGVFGTALESAGIELRQLGMRRGKPHPAGLLHLTQIIREVRPNLVQSWLYHADLLGLVAGFLVRIPRLVWNIQCTDMRDAPSLAGAMLPRLLGWSAKIPDAVVVNSRAGQAFHERIGYRPRRWEFIPNGIDVRAFRPDLSARACFRQGLGIDDDVILIGLAARFHPMKDHGTFLSAAALVAAAHRNIRFVLAGTGADSGNRAVTDAIDRLGLSEQVLLLGERHDMPRFFAGLDIAALSSAYGEGCPNVLGEAMASGVTCVSTDVGDSAAMIGDTGVVVPAGEPGAFAAALNELIAIGRERRRVLGLRARARIEQNFELGPILARYEALYTQLAQPA